MCLISLVGARTVEGSSRCRHLQVAGGHLGVVLEGFFMRLGADVATLVTHREELQADLCGGHALGHHDREHEIRRLDHAVEVVGLVHFHLLRWNSWYELKLHDCNSRI